MNACFFFICLQETFLSVFLLDNVESVGWKVGHVFAIRSALHNEEKKREETFEKLPYGDLFMEFHEAIGYGLVESSNIIRFEAQELDSDCVGF